MKKVIMSLIAFLPLAASLGQGLIANASVSSQANTKAAESASSAASSSALDPIGVAWTNELSTGVLAYLREKFDVSNQLQIDRIEHLPIQPGVTHQIAIRGHYPDHLAPRMRIDIGILDDEKLIETVPFWVALSLRQPGYVATRTLGVDDTISDSASKRIVEYLLSNCQPAHSLTGKRLTRSIDVGDVICNEHLELIPDVERGSSVELLYQQQGITLTVPATAIEPGLIGQRILVQVLPTKARIPAVVLASRRVRHANDS